MCKVVKKNSNLGYMVLIPVEESFKFAAPFEEYTGSGQLVMTVGLSALNNQQLKRPDYEYFNKLCIDAPHKNKLYHIDRPIADGDQGGGVFSFPNRNLIGIMVDGKHYSNHSHGYSNRVVIVPLSEIFL